MFYFEQETSEQQEAEKDWIEQQRRKLDQVQKQINMILIDFEASGFLGSPSKFTMILIRF